MNMRNTLIGLLALIASSLAVAGKKEVELNPQHPAQYVVAAGDTLWGIAEKFLNNPWQWPDLWTGDRNRPLRPGDVLALVEIDGKPRLQLSTSAEAAPRRPGQELPVVKLSPNIRATPMAEVIPIIPINMVRGFLSSPKVVDEQTLERAPYVLELTDQRVVAGSGDKVYVRGLLDDSSTGYGLFHQGAAFLDGESDEPLGYEAIYVAGARLLQEGDPALFTLTHSKREVRIGDRLLPLDEERLPTYYQPHAPDTEVRGHIINLLGAENVGIRNSVPRIGQYSVVVLDRGSNDGLEVGHVLNIQQKSRVVADKLSGKAYDSAEIPEEVIGSLLVFRPFERVSFALVMKAQRDLLPGDVVQTP